MLPEFQNIGSGLVKAGLNKTKELGFQSVILLSHERSITPRFGFAPISTYGIKATFEEPDHVFMALELEPRALQTASGILHYPKEFDGI